MHVLNLVFLLAATPSLISATSTCDFTHNVIFFSYSLNLDNTSCDDRGRLEQIVKDENLVTIPCAALTNGDCNPRDRGAIFAFNVAVFCGVELVQDAIRQFTGEMGVTCE